MNWSLIIPFLFPSKFWPTEIKTQNRMEGKDGSFITNKVTSSYKLDVWPQTFQYFCWFTLGHSEPLAVSCPHCTGMQLTCLHSTKEQKRKIYRLSRDWSKWGGAEATEPHVSSFSWAQQRSALDELFAGLNLH